jgi:hypothetical protein
MVLRLRYRRSIEQQIEAVIGGQVIGDRCARASSVRHLRGPERIYLVQSLKFKVQSCPNSSLNHLKKSHNRDRAHFEVNM